MNKICLTKSDYCDCKHCKKLYWLKKFKPINPDDDVAKKKKPILEKGNEVGELAKGLFGDYNDIQQGTKRAMIEETERLMLEKPNIITEASFSYEDNFCQVDILKNDLDGVEIYEVKSSTSIYKKNSKKIKERYLDDVAFQYFVLSNLGLNVKKVCIVVLNNKYRLGRKLDIKKLFKKEDLTLSVKGEQDIIRDNIDEFKKFIKEYDETNEPSIDLGMCCLDPHTCDFWEYCTKDLPKPNVFDLSGMDKSVKFKKYYDDKISFEDLEDVLKQDLIEKPKSKKIANCLEQVDFEQNNKPAKIKEGSIEKILDKIEQKYPLYFIDYETIQPAIPIFKGTKPYQQIPFQYSLHIIKEKGAPEEHKEFLAKHDDMDMIRNFAKHMIKDMPEEGCVIVYNKKFEAKRNEEIGKLYPCFEEKMNGFNCNMIDLMIPFKERDYYTKEMQGSHSLKYVLPALYPDDPELDYSKLPVVHNGGEASEAFESLKDKSPKEQQEIREGLLKYCELDTLAMVKIWKKFKEVTE